MPSPSRIPKPAWMQHRNSKSSPSLTLLRYEKAIRYNGAQIQLWKKFVEFAVQNHYLVNNDEEKCKQILERSIDNIGLHMKSSEIWNQFIDYETSLNNMGFANLLCYLAIKTPLVDSDQMLEK